MYLYGTRKSLVQDVFDQGKSVIKEMEINGWTSVVEKPEVKEYCYSIFMDIPDEEMVRRILERNPETPHIEIENRLESAQIEREQALMLCDYYVDVFEMSREEQASYVKKVVDYLVNKTD
jgi:guanylate kinase